MTMTMMTLTLRSGSYWTEPADPPNQHHQTYLCRRCEILTPTQRVLILISERLPLKWQTHLLREPHVIDLVSTASPLPSTSSLHHSWVGYEHRFRRSEHLVHRRIAPPREVRPTHPYSTQVGRPQYSCTGNEIDVETSGPCFWRSTKKKAMKIDEVNDQNDGTPIGHVSQM